MFIEGISLSFLKMNLMLRIGGLLLKRFLKAIGRLSQGLISLKVKLPVVRLIGMLYIE
jgi:hypothetical protein